MAVHILITGTTARHSLLASVTEVAIHITVTDILTTMAAIMVGTMAAITVDTMAAITAAVIMAGSMFITAVVEIMAAVDITVVVVDTVVAVHIMEAPGVIVAALAAFA